MEEEKETLFDRLEEEAKEYFIQFVTECKIESWNSRLPTKFIAHFILLKVKWFIEACLMIFLEALLFILIWKLKFEVEVRTIAKVLSSVSVAVLFNYIYASSKIKHLNDMVKMEVSLFNNNKDLFTIKEDTHNGGSEAE